MRLSALPANALRERLHGPGLVLRTGPFSFRIRSPIESIAEGLSLLYADYPLPDPQDFVDFDVHLPHSGGLRRWWHPQVNFVYDGDAPFEPLPLDHAFPLLEWSMNWCISTQAHQYLMLHAAVIERHGRAVILPAPPGSGKSTLCAGLIQRGWRLLSDELALISLEGDLLLTPLCRPVSLKNQSLEVIRRFEPGVVLNRPTPDTTKGTVAHMKVDRDHLSRVAEPARPGWVVFPRYVAGAAPRLSPRSRADSMLELGRNAFNYSTLGLTGFERLAALVDASSCHDFEYSRLEDAVAVFDALAASAASP